MAYFGLRCYGMDGLHLGDINMNLTVGIRFDRDAAGSTEISMDDVYVEGGTGHAVDTWNIGGFNIDRVTAHSVGGSGLLIQNFVNGRVGTVDSEDVATGSGCATFRMADNDGQESDGGYDTNIWVGEVISRGGRGVFCVSQSGGVVINHIDLADNDNLSIRSGTGRRRRRGLRLGPGRVPQHSGRLDLPRSQRHHRQGIALRRQRQLADHRQCNDERLLSRCPCTASASPEQVLPLDFGRR